MLTTILVECACCHDTKKVVVRVEDWHRYINGALVQDAFPYLPCESRELLISHICPHCWRTMFKVDEDDEECDHNCNLCPMAEICMDAY